MTDITREQLKTMTPKQINDARLKGQLAHLMTSPNPDRTVTPVGYLSDAEFMSNRAKWARLAKGDTSDLST